MVGCVTDCGRLLVDKTAVQTGLPVNNLRSLARSQLYFDADTRKIGSTKNNQAASACSCRESGY